MSYLKRTILAPTQGKRRFPSFHAPSLFREASDKELKQMRARFSRQYLQQFLRLRQNPTVDWHPDSAKLQAGPLRHASSEAQVMSLQLSAYTRTRETEQ